MLHKFNHRIVQPQIPVHAKAQCKECGYILFSKPSRILCLLGEKGQALASAKIWEQTGSNRPSFRFCFQAHWFSLRRRKWV
jgi:hypothetical protein